MVTYSITRPRFYTVCSLCPAITPHALPLLLTDERLTGQRVSRGGKKMKKAPLPCSAMLSFLFLLCQSSEQPGLPICFALSLPSDCFVKPSGQLTVSRCSIRSVSWSCCHLVIPRKRGKCGPNEANTQIKKRDSKKYEYSIEKHSTEKCLSRD